MTEIVQTETENITLPEAVTFYKKYKNFIWGAIIAIASMTGTNVDRIGEFLPDSLLKDARVDDLIVRVEKLEEYFKPDFEHPVIKDAITRDYNKDN